MYLCFSTQCQYTHIVYRCHVLQHWHLASLLITSMYNSEDTCKTMSLHVRRLNAFSHTHPSMYIPLWAQCIQFRGHMRNNVKACCPQVSCTAVLYLHLASLLITSSTLNLLYSCEQSAAGVCGGHYQTELLKQWQTSHGTCEWNPLKLPHLVEHRTPNTVHRHNWDSILHICVYVCMWGMQQVGWGEK